MKTVRWGMIGCGAVTEVKSGPAFRKAQGSELVAVASRTVSSARDYARRHAVASVYERVDDLIAAPDVDAVYVATPPDSHRDLALKVAMAGKPCCVEKPMALDHRQCLEMVAAFEARGLPLFVSYYRRSLPRFLEVRRWLSQGLIGPVRQVSWRLTRPPSPRDLSGAPNWRTDPRTAPGGYFSDLASHGLDLFQFLLGDITAASGTATNRRGLYAAEDSVTAAWAFANGARGDGHWDFVSDRRGDQVRIEGREGHIDFSVFDDVPLTLRANRGERSLVIPNPPNIQLHHVENMVVQLLGGPPHPSPGREAAKTSRVMDDILGDRREA